MRLRNNSPNHVRAYHIEIVHKRIEAYRVLRINTNDEEALGIHDRKVRARADDRAAAC